MQFRNILIIFILVLFSFSFKAQAANAPELFVNDTLRECTVYAPNNNTYLLKGWHQPNTYVNWNDWQNYCKSLGYTFQKYENATEKTEHYKKVLKISEIVKTSRIALLIILISIYFKKLIISKRKYFLFVLYSILTFLALIVISDIVVYITTSQLCIGLNIIKILCPA